MQFEWWFPGCDLEQDDCDREDDDPDKAKKCARAINGTKKALPGSKFPVPRQRLGTEIPVGFLSAMAVAGRARAPYARVAREFFGEFANLRAINRKCRI
jgi:hypothetical protein